MVSGLKKNRKKIPFANILFVAGVLLFLFIAGYLFFTNTRLYVKKVRLNAQIENLKKQIAEIENRNKELEEGISIADDEQYIEKIAREDLGLQKPGETAVSFVETKQEKEGDKNYEQKGLWQNWFSWLASLFSRD